MAGSAKRVIGTILFIIALAATAFFVFLLFADAENLDGVPLVGEVSTVALVTAVALGVITLLLILVMMLRKWDRQEKEAEEAEVFFIPQEYRPEVPEGDGVPVEPLATDTIVAYDLWSVPLDLRGWGQDGSVAVYHYPRAAERAVFANDYIDVGSGQRLKLRTLLAGPPGAFRNTFESEPSRPVAKDEPWDGDLAGSADEAVEPEAATETVEEQTYEEYTWDETEEAEETPEAEEIPEVTVRPRRERGLDDVLQELESRYTKDSSLVMEEPKPESEAYFDYAGDVHDVIDIEGIGPVYAEKLRDAGIKTTARLCYEEAATVAEATGAPEKTVRNWQSQAELIKVSGIGPQYAEALARAGIEGIAELKKRSARTVANQVNAYLEGLETNVLGTKITERRVESWKEAAKPMRRVRRPVPEQ